MEELNGLELLAYRASNYDRPLRNIRHQLVQRFNRVGDDPVQYLSLHPLGPWAEHLRSSDRRLPEDAADLRIRYWAIRVFIDRALSLSFDSVSKAPELEIEPFDLVSNDYDACQDLAGRLLADPSAPRTLIVPSAALPGTRNLVLFGRKVGVDFDSQPIDPDVDVPSSLAADHAQPLLTLLPLVRFRGDSHTEFEAWRAGEAFEFDQPPTPFP